MIYMTLYYTNIIMVKLLQRGREVCAVQVIVLGLQDALGLPDKVPVVVPKQLSAKAAIGV